jgi:hypothetical protein
MRSAVSIALIALALSSNATAADRKIDDFVGRWVGTGQATQGVVNPVKTQSRDSEVIIERTADGFKISWTTMSTNVSEPTKSKVKSAELKFKRAKKAGLFVELASGHALDGKKTTWARLSGNTLSITQLVVADDGQWDVTVYERTLKGADQMSLAFTRVTNGVVARQASLAMSHVKE